MLFLEMRTRSRSRRSRM